MRKTKYLIYGVLCLAVFLTWWGILYISDMGNHESQKIIFSKLTHLTAQELSSVELQFVKKRRLIEKNVF